MGLCIGSRCSPGERRQARSVLRDGGRWAGEGGVQARVRDVRQLQRPAARKPSSAPGSSSPLSDTGAFWVQGTLKARLWTIASCWQGHPAWRGRGGLELALADQGKVLPWPVPCLSPTFPLAYQLLNSGLFKASLLGPPAAVTALHPPHPPRHQELPPPQKPTPETQPACPSLARQRPLVSRTHVKSVSGHSRLPKNPENRVHALLAPIHLVPSPGIAPPTRPEIPNIVNTSVPQILKSEPIS